MWVRRGNPFLATEGNFLRCRVAPLNVDGAVEENFVVGRNDIKFAICYAEVDAPDEDGFELKIVFAAEKFPVDATNDGPEDGRVSGDCDVRAVGGFGNFLNYYR